MLYILKLSVKDMFIYVKTALDLKALYLVLLLAFNYILFSFVEFI